jgi:ATP-dependent exoDNAse (exonuclease V) alpha subunit
VNAAADVLNQERLSRLPGVAKIFRGEFRGKFPEYEAPTDIELHLKKDARVMCVANDPGGQFVNGSLGVVTGFERDSELGVSVMVKLDDGGKISVSPHAWTVYRSTYDRATNMLDQEKLGSFTQIPLRLAWAVTIHKSQGKTFDQVTIDLGRGAFATGQTYVALSRCRSFEGIYLASPVQFQDIRLDNAIVKFIDALQRNSFQKQRLL